MAINHAACPSSFPWSGSYPCSLHFRGWPDETLAGTLRCGLESLNGHNPRLESGWGFYRATNFIYQGGTRLRNRLTRISRSIQGQAVAGQDGAADPADGFFESASVQSSSAEPRLESRPVDFRALAAHDMKSSLVLMGGFIRRLIVQSANLDERQRRYLEIILQEGCKLEQLLEEFLASSGREGELRLQPQVVFLDRELQDLCESYQLSAARRQITVRFQGGGGVIPILGDRLHLQRAFGNLIENALKFSPAGSTVQVRILARGDELSISFMDEGPGIDDHDLPHVFEPHYRGRTREETKGSGLGLATVRAVVAAHGGRILVRNRQEGGAVFSIVLPAPPLNGLVPRPAIMIDEEKTQATGS